MEKLSLVNLSDWRQRWVHAQALPLGDIMELAGETLHALQEGSWALGLRLQNRSYDVRIYDRAKWERMPEDKGMVMGARRMEDGITDAFLRMLYFFKETGRIEDGSWR